MLLTRRPFEGSLITLRFLLYNPTCASCILTTDYSDRCFMPVCAYVSLGSNLGDRAGNLLLAVRGMLDAGLLVRRLSAVYETEPVDVREQPAFLNMVAE